MKKLAAIVLALVLVASVSTVAFAGNGNNAPSGAHYNLNIIGVPNDMNDNFNGGNGARIFVSRTNNTTFYVGAGSSYQVNDHDGTDGYVGTGPNPKAAEYEPGIIFPYNGTASPTWRVEIWVRLVGPNCDENTLGWVSKYWDGDQYVQWAAFTLSKSSKFSLKTGDLLKDQYQDILWDIDPGTKFRICQMRIYLLD